MSLNRCEQRVFDYLEKHPDERHYWHGKLQRAIKEVGNEYVAVERMEAELWRYYVERAAVVPALKQAAASEGLQRTSMKNLAELMMRLWIAPRPKKNPPG